MSEESLLGTVGGGGENAEEMEVDPKLVEEIDNAVKELEEKERKDEESGLPKQDDDISLDFGEEDQEEVSQSQKGAGWNESNGSDAGGGDAVSGRRTRSRSAERQKRQEEIERTHPMDPAYSCTEESLGLMGIEGSLCCWNKRTFGEAARLIGIRPFGRQAEDGLTTIKELARYLAVAVRTDLFDDQKEDEWNSRRPQRCSWSAETALLIATSYCEHVKAATLFERKENPNECLWKEIRNNGGNPWSEGFAWVKEECMKGRMRVRTAPTSGYDVWFVPDNDNYYGCWKEVTFRHGTVCQSLEEMERKIKEAPSTPRFIFFSPSLDMNMDKLRMLMRSLNELAVRKEMTIVVFSQPLGGRIEEMKDSAAAVYELVEGWRRFIQEGDVRVPTCVNLLYDGQESVGVSEYFLALGTGRDRQPLKDWELVRYTYSLKRCLKSMGVSSMFEGVTIRRDVDEEEQGGDGYQGGPVSQNVFKDGYRTNHYDGRCYGRSNGGSGFSRGNGFSKGPNDRSVCNGPIRMSRNIQETGRQWRDGREGGGDVRFPNKRSYPYTKDGRHTRDKESHVSRASHRG